MRQRKDQRQRKTFGMKTEAWILLFVIGCVCAGCGTYRWQKPGATDAGFKQDSAACERTHGDTAAGFDACMNEQGWKLR
jgi:hypothetical protein